MGAIDFRSLTWAVNRWFLMRGKLAWLISAVWLVLTIQVLLLAMSLLRLASLDQEQGVAPTVAAVDVSPPTDEPFPAFSERFALTAQALSKLKAGEIAPGKIKFAYDPIQDSRVIRQTATVAMNANWQELGPMLDSAQAIGRTAYLSRLRLAREDAGQSELKAEIQVTIAYRDVEEAGAQ